MDLFTTKIYGQKNNKTIIIFGGLGSTQLLFWFLGQILSAYKFRAIIYTYHAQILSPDPQTTCKNIDALTRDVLKTIKKLKKKEKKELAVFGTSLGTIPAVSVAKEIPAVKKIILSTPIFNLSETVWTWNKKNFNFRKELQQRKITRKKLKEEWFELNPQNNLDLLTDRKFLLFSAIKDEVIPHSQTLKYIQELEKEEIYFEAIINNRHHHITASILTIFKYQTYIQFLNRK